MDVVDLRFRGLEIVIHIPLSHGNSSSSTWHFLCHSDQHVPEWMQATARISYENCGRRFRCKNFWKDAGRDIKGRCANLATLF